MLVREHEDGEEIEVFGRLDEDGDVMVLHVEDGVAVTRMDLSIYPVRSDLSARYEHPEGIVLTREDVERIGLEIEA